MWSALAFIPRSSCHTLYPLCAPSLRRVPHPAPRLQFPSLQTPPSSTATFTHMPHLAPPLRRHHSSPRHLIVRRECIPSQVIPAPARLPTLLFVHGRRYSPCSVRTSQSPSAHSVRDTSAGQRSATAATDSDCGGARCGGEGNCDGGSDGVDGAIATCNISLSSLPRCCRLESCPSPCAIPASSM